ncbi:MAG TPA: tetratricopeptide repeat protein [Bryobacteraceae bacterium]|nr:tetratricopeptide repeat protein [Bryobacteraceae bacterium]
MRNPTALPAVHDRPAGGEPAVKEYSQIYRCEDIEIDPSLGCLKRGGTEQHLRQQSFHLLLYMIERRQRLISKDELIENFWQDAAVTDNAVVQCIKEIRTVLGDDPHDPRFIRTIYKLGYRFIANVVEEPVATDAGKPALPEVAAPPPVNDERTIEPPAPHPHVVRLWPSLSWAGLRWIVLGLAATGGIALAWTMFRHSSTPAVELTLPRVPGRKALAVMYFENQSANPNLNWLSEGLADMFITDLARFDKLTVLSREQLHLLLDRNGLKPQNGIHLDDAIDVARKSHAEALLLGSFLTLGEKILINTRVFETSTGQLLAADQFEVDQPADILARIDLLSPKLAAHLGAVPADPRHQASLAESMTNNLEAYRYYSLGVSKAQAFQNAQAIGLLRKAIQLDPTFALAYARIGYAYSVTDFVPEQGRPFLAKAIQLSDRLSPKDRLLVTAWYAIAREDYAAAIRTMQQVVDQYPLEIEGYTRLARLLYGEERPQEAIGVVRRGLAIDPEFGDLYNVLGVCYLLMDRYDQAIAAHQRYVQLAPSEANAHDSLGMSFQHAGKFESASAEYNGALALDPEFEPAIIHLGDMYFQQGAYREAIRQYQRYIQVTGSDKARAIGYGSIAQIYLRLKEYSNAEQAARSETNLEKGAVWNSLLLSLDRGRATGLKESLEQILRRGPNATRGSRNELRSYEYFLGTLELRQKHTEQALRHFKDALHHQPPSSGMDLYEDCLGNAYLDLGRLEEAIDEYQRILRLNPNYPLAQYHLGQAYQRKGQTADARIAYERFLQIWKNADANIPEVMDAKRELTLLKSGT